jgi:hypothetical protein
MSEFLQIIGYILPAALVTYAMYLMVRTFVAKELQKLRLEQKKLAIEKTLPLRLQAYERMALYVERLSLENLLPRLLEPGMQAEQFARKIKREIKDELMHNVAQQIYVNEATWQAILEAKRGVDALVDAALQSENSPVEAPAFGQLVLKLAMEQAFDKPVTAMQALKKEVQELF